MRSWPCWKKARSRGPHSSFSHGVELNFKTAEEIRNAELQLADDRQLLGDRLLQDVLDERHLIQL